MFITGLICKITIFPPNYCQLLQPAPSSVKKILVAPLEWGLGHATRCIPLIEALQQEGCEVVVAAGGAPAALLREAFPKIRLLSPPVYHVRYAHHGAFLPFILLQQLPALKKTMKAERQWLEQLLENEHFDAVIADNRPGLHSYRCPCVYITHQLQISSGMGSLGDSLLRQWHLRLIRKFQYLWVPDEAGATNVAGKLSHPGHYPLPVQYLGPLSRFQPKNLAHKDIDVLFLLSGPEPQRTLLEKKIFAEIGSFRGKAVLVRGKPDGNHDKLDVESYDHLPPHALQEMLLRSHLVICRSGYTTLMDLLLLKVKAVLIPTPGQTEQQYLARHMKAMGCFPYVSQKNFSLHRALKEARDFPFSFPLEPAAFQQHRQVIRDFVAHCLNH